MLSGFLSLTFSKIPNLNWDSVLHLPRKRTKRFLSELLIGQVMTDDMWNNWRKYAAAGQTRNLWTDWIQDEFKMFTHPVGKRNNKLILTLVISYAGEYGRHLCARAVAVVNPLLPVAINQSCDRLVGQPMDCTNT